jgi:2-octaprenyl-6-methoxyphenol hydroxylase
MCQAEVRTGRQVSQNSRTLSQSATPPAEVDVVIAGGGQVGLALALSLRLSAPALTVLVVDASDPNSNPRRSRVSTLAAGSRHVLERLGVWDDVAGQAQPVNSMIVTDSRTRDTVRPLFLTFDTGTSDRPGAHVVADGVVVEALARHAVGAGVQVVAPDSVVDFEAGRSRIICRTSAGHGVAARLLVAADGARSRLRDLAGITTFGWSYHQSGIVATMAHERPHQGRAEEHFLPGGPFAILPMLGNHSSLVWTEPTEVAKRLVAGGPLVLDAELKRRVGRRLGAISLVDQPRTFPLGLRIARSFIGQRFALAGDSAHAIHPIAGQGLNLGYRDVAALAQSIVEAHRLGLDVGDATVLSRYDGWRRFDTVEMGLMSDGLNRLFSNDNPALRLTRDVGLGLVDRLPALKRLFVAEARGDTPGAPRLLRGEAI